MTKQKAVQGRDLPPLWVLSLGAGVQSSTVLLMHLEGELGIPIHHAIFADTGWEPTATYKHLEWLEAQIRERDPGLTFHRVSKGSRLQDDVLATSLGLTDMPLFAREGDGPPTLTKRQCTTQYKIAPVRSKIWQLIEGKRSRRVHQIIGISYDEAERMKPSRVGYIQNEYPLVRARMTRGDCAGWLLKHGYPIPPKSSCIGCPFHDNGLWLDMRENRPEEWAEAVAFDRAIRHREGVRGTLYLHPTGVPLDQVILKPRPPRPKQLQLMDAAVGKHWQALEGGGFGAECEGMCGV